MKNISLNGKKCDCKWISEVFYYLSSSAKKDITTTNIAKNDSFYRQKSLAFGFFFISFVWIKLNYYDPHFLFMGKKAIISKTLRGYRRAFKIRDNLASTHTYKLLFQLLFSQHQNNLFLLMTTYVHLSKWIEKINNWSINYSIKKNYEEVTHKVSHESFVKMCWLQSYKMLEQKETKLSFCWNKKYKTLPYLFFFFEHLILRGIIRRTSL